MNWEALRGWKWKKLTAAAAGDVAVKTGSGLVARLYVETSTVVCFVKDGTNQAWTSVTGAGGQEFQNPLNTNGDISVNFSAAGTAWILYQ
jgi:hypothetical protein